MHDSILIERRFCGPPACANGGHAAGRLAAALGEGLEPPVQVRLHRPPPLDVPLTSSQASPSILTSIPSPTALSAGRCASTVMGYESSRARFRTPTRASPAVAEPHILMSRVTGIEGRKRFSQAMLSDANGAIYAISSAIWIELAARS